MGPITVEPTGNPDEFQITANLRNLGDLAVENFSADFYLGAPDNGGTLLGSLPNIYLDGGNACDQSLVTSGLPPGADGVVYVRADPADLIAELDETNNTATTALNPVDLVAANLLWELSSDESLLTLTGTVRNNGRTTQSNIPVEIHGEQGLFLTATIPTLPPGAVVAVPGVLTTASTFPTDDNLFVLKVDPAETLVEPNRTDNEYSLPLTLREPSTFFLDTPQSGPNFIVNTASDHPPGIAGVTDCTLRKAVVAANSNVDASVITFDPTVFASAQIINLTGVLADLSTDIDIQGPSLGVTVRRDTGGDYRLFNVSSGVTVSLNQLTISNGRTFAAIGGGIRSLGNLTIHGSTISGNTAQSGGGIGIEGGSLTLRMSTLSGNRALLRGGGLYTGFGALIGNTTISGNTAGTVTAAGVVL